MPKSETVTQEPFYATSPGLVWFPEPSRRVIHDGQAEVIDAPPIRFTPIGDGYGLFIAKTPEQIAHCRRRLKEVGDVIDGKTFAERTTPPEIKLEQAGRTIVTQNRLISELQNKLTKMKGGLSSATK